MNNTKTAVVAIIEKDGKILIGKKGHWPGHVLSDAWHIPGGILKEGESEEEGLMREMLEETGLKIKIGRFFDQRVSENGWKVSWYLCSPLTHDLVPGDDLVDAKFVPRSEVVDQCSPIGISFWPDKVKEFFRN